MIQNNSQDENIPLLTEVWPWPMSRELSVRYYFGTYLQTSTKSLFWLMYFFTFGKSTEKILRWTRSFTQTFMLLMLFTSYFCVLCLQTGNVKWHFPELIGTATDLSHIISTYDYSQQQIHIIYCQLSTGLWGCTWSWELRFITAEKTYDPINILSTFGNDNSFQRGKHLSSQAGCDEVSQLAVRENHNRLFPTIQARNDAAKRWTDCDIVW